MVKFIIQAVVDGKKINHPSLETMGYDKLSVGMRAAKDNGIEQVCITPIMEVALFDEKDWITLDQIMSPNTDITITVPSKEEMNSTEEMRNLWLGGGSDSPDLGCVCSTCRKERREAATKPVKEAAEKVKAQEAKKTMRPMKRKTPKTPQPIVAVETDDSV